MLYQVTVGSKVSLVEDFPRKGSVYARATNSKAVIVSKNYVNFTLVLKLPSKFRRVFSLFVLGTLWARTDLPKKTLFSGKAGSIYNRGLRPKTRGVAKNPVDHPHGGRTKTIKSPQTPWGKTAKRGK